MKKNLFVLLLLIAITAVAFSSTFLYVKLNNKDDDQGMLVMTSCNPVYIATLNVVGNVDSITVQNLSQPTTGCLHDYSLTAEDMKKLSRADALVISGGGMEGYLEDVINAYPNLTIIDASVGIELIHSDENDEHSHEHHDDNAEEDDHEHGSFNSHYWLSLPCYIKAVENISQSLSQLDRENAEQYSKNTDVYKAELDMQLGSVENGLFDQMSGSSVAILHEAYEYIASDLSLDIVAVMDLDEERQVSAGEIADLVDEIEEHDVQIIFAESDYGKAVGDLLEEHTDAKVVYLNTLIHGTYDSSSYVKEMLNNYELIKEQL